MYIVHDYLTQRGGAERVVLSMLGAFPHATLITSVHTPATTYPEFADYDVHTLWPSRLRPFRNDHRRALPVLAQEFGSTRLTGDVLCSSSGWAHGVKVSHGRKVVYCHTPARWLFDTGAYSGASGGRCRALVVRALRCPLGRWDAAAAASAHRYLTNSSAVAARIKDFYDVEARVLPPPMTLRAAEIRHARSPILSERYALVVSRLLPYKQVDQAIIACRQVGLPLVVVGSGPERAYLGRLTGRHPVRFLAELSEAELDQLYRRASVLIAPAREDFGLTPLEANSRGVPVVALAAGGYLDTVLPGTTGLLYEPGGLAAALAAALTQHWDRDRLARHAAGYSEGAFTEALVEELSGAGRDPHQG